MKHNMKLFKEPFDMISNGKKTIELRLYDEKRKLVKVGDTIVFSSLDDINRKLKTEVIAIHRFNSFEELYEKLPLDKCGYRTKENAKPEDMLDYYSKDEQEKYGVVGIEIRLC